MYVKRTLSFIENNFEDDINVEEIAKVVDLSASLFHISNDYSKNRQTYPSLIKSMNSESINENTKMIGCSPPTYKKLKGNQHLNLGSPIYIKKQKKLSVIFKI